MPALPAGIGMGGPGRKRATNTNLRAVPAIPPHEDSNDKLITQAPCILMKASLNHRMEKIESRISFTCRSCHLFSPQLPYHPQSAAAPVLCLLASREGRRPGLPHILRNTKAPQYRPRGFRYAVIAKTRLSCPRESREACLPSSASGGTRGRAFS